jgi:hypothetical protein
MNPKLLAGLGAAWRSLYITASGLGLALLVGASAAGATTNVPALVAYLKTQWLTCTIANVAIPLLRGAIAAKQEKGNP